MSIAPDRRDPAAIALRIKGEPQGARANSCSVKRTPKRKRSKAAIESGGGQACSFERAKSDKVLARDRIRLAVAAPEIGLAPDTGQILLACTAWGYYRPRFRPRVGD